MPKPLKANRHLHQSRMAVNSRMEKHCATTRVRWEKFGKRGCKRGSISQDEPTPSFLQMLEILVCSSSPKQNRKNWIRSVKIKKQCSKITMCSDSCKRIYEICVWRCHLFKEEPAFGEKNQPCFKFAGNPDKIYMRKTTEQCLYVPVYQLGMCWKPHMREQSVLSMLLTHKRCWRTLQGRHDAPGNKHRLPLERFVFPCLSEWLKTRGE